MSQHSKENQPPIPDGSIPDDLAVELHALAIVSFDGSATDEELARLDQIVCENPGAAQYLARCVQTSRHLCDWAGSLTSGASSISGKLPRRSPILGFLSNILPIDSHTPMSAAAMWMIAVLGVIVLGGVSAVVMVLVNGITVHVDNAAPQVVQHGAIHPQAAKTNPAPAPEPVARLTRTVDCIWAAAADVPEVGDEFRAGRLLSLESGLAEVAFKNGAVMILQGPATLDVDSRTSAFLKQGKCTVAVETPLAKGFEIRTPGMKFTDLGTEFGVAVDRRGEQVVRVFRGKVAAEVEPSSVGCPINWTRASPSIKNTDGLEVHPTFNPAANAADRGGRTASTHPEANASGSPGTNHQPRAALILNAHEAIRVAAADNAGQRSNTIERIAENNAAFVRAMPKTFDLADVVAGGDGFSARTGRGINQRTGELTEEKLLLEGSSPSVYHKVSGVKYLDGVFVPNGGAKPVQLDSAGHSYGLPKTCGRTDHCIFAETAKPLADRQRGLSLSRTPLADNLAYALVSNHPQLYMHANSGITFDLEPFRASPQGWRPTRFQAMLCTERSDNPGAVMSAWVFVDGQLRYQKQKFSLKTGFIGIDIPLDQGAHFLTLVATDANANNINSRHVVFHCPQLVLEDGKTD